MSDPLNWLDGALGSLLHGPMHRFTFSQQSDYTGIQVEKILRQYGIRTWGRQATEDEAGILVKRSQAVWAEYLLCRAGVPLTGPLLDPRNATYRQTHAMGTMPVPWKGGGIGAHTLVDHVIDWVDRWLG